MFIIKRIMQAVENWAEPWDKGLIESLYTKIKFNLLDKIDWLINKSM